MGCGASVPKEATEDQKMQLCAVAGKDMLYLCSAPALDKFDQVKVPAPPEVARLRGDVASLRKAASEARGQILGEPGAAPAAEAPKAAAPTGMMGMLQKGADMAGKAAESAINVAGGAAATAAETALNAMADQLEKVIDAVEAPFTEVGKDILTEKNAEIKKVFEMHIANLPMATSGVSIPLTRGSEATTAEEYAKVPTNALTDHLCRKCGANLVAQLLPVCEDAIKKHRVTSTWDSVITNFNSLSAKIAALDFAKQNDVALTPVELDISDYIVSQCVEGLAKLMGEIETDFRKKTQANPAGGAPPGTKAPETFVAVFGVLPLTEKVYKNNLNNNV